MLNIIKYKKKHRAWQKKFNAQAPKLGDIAPDFELHDINGQNSVRLSDFRRKSSVVLIFGSFT